MVNVLNILTYLQYVFFALIILLTTIYSIPILFIPRFHVRYNILTANICLTILSCTLYFLAFAITAAIDIKILFRDSTCGFLLYMQMMCVCQGSHSIVLISINQLCDIVYHRNRFFQTNKWLTICMPCQWMMSAIVSIPAYMRTQWFCSSPIGIAYYKAFMIIVIPAIVCVIIHVVIFSYIRSSTRRVQAQQQISRTSTNNMQRPKISRRDLHLLRHMIFIFVIYMIGWGPNNFLGIVSSYVQVNQIITTSGSLLAQISAMVIILDLYIYNHELRDYLRRKFCSCF